MILRIEILWNIYFFQIKKEKHRLIQAKIQAGNVKAPTKEGHHHIRNLGNSHEYYNR